MLRQYYLARIYDRRASADLQSPQLLTEQLADNFALRRNEHPQHPPLYRHLAHPLPLIILRRPLPHHHRLMWNQQPYQQQGYAPPTGGYAGAPPPQQGYGYQAPGQGYGMNQSYGMLQPQPQHQPPPFPPQGQYPGAPPPQAYGGHSPQPPYQQQQPYAPQQQQPYHAPPPQQFQQGPPVQGGMTMPNPTGQPMFLGTPLPPENPAPGAMQGYNAQFDAERIRKATKVSRHH